MVVRPIQYQHPIRTGFETDAKAPVHRRITSAAEYFRIGMEKKAGIHPGRINRHHSIPGIGMTVILKYPEYPGGKWAQWAEFCRQVIDFYGPDRITIKMVADVKLSRPVWIIRSRDPMLVSMIELTCTVLTFFHRYYIRDTRRDVPHA